MARPWKNNPTWKQKSPAKEKAEKDGKLLKFFEALKWWLSRSSAIAFAGLNIDTVYWWLARDETFKKKVEYCEEYRIWVVENKKKQKIDEWYRPAIEKELESSKFERYWKRERKDVNIEWNINMKDLSDEELIKIIKGG